MFLYFAACKAGVGLVPSRFLTVKKVFQDQGNNLVKRNFKPFNQDWIQFDTLSLPGSFKDCVVNSAFGAGYRGMEGDPCGKIL